MLRAYVFLPRLVACSGKEGTYNQTLLYHMPPSVVYSFSQPLCNVYSVVVSHAKERRVHAEKLMVMQKRVSKAMDKIVFVAFEYGWQNGP